MDAPLPLYHQFYDRLTAAPWQAQPAETGKGFAVIGGVGCGCMALGETLVSGLAEFDARVIANAPEALSLVLRMARHLEKQSGDAEAAALVAEARATFAELGVGA